MRFLENEYATLWIEDGILFCKYKEGSRINIEAAKTIVDMKLSLLNGSKLPCYCDITGLKEADKMARDFIAKRIDSFLTKLALVAGNTVSRIIGDFFIGLDKPKIETKIFTDKQSALEFLKA